MITPVTLPLPLLPLASPDASLETVGGKGLNLSKLARAGFNVPDGFLIPTSCYQDFVEHNHLSTKIQDFLRDLDLNSPEDLAAASDAIRTQFSRGSLSSDLTAALEIGWRWLGAQPVAVRSSATAEDLPDLSFAGQQDTFLHVIGDAALQKAVIDCWSSLWTARAIGYRARNHIPHQEVSLSVVVQKMVQSEASGVLFTANPLTGKRSETVIDATLGLGEALVGGQVEPDHYVVDSQKSAITHKFQGSKSIIIRGKTEGGVAAQEADSSQQQAIPDDIILELAKTGKEIENLYNFPQDIEWAWVSSPNPYPLTPIPVGEGSIFILQSRPITSLFPLPDGMKSDPLKVLVGFHAVQGIVDPLTPLGQDTMKLVLTGAGRLFGMEPTLENQTAFYSAAERLWMHVTSILRHPIGNRVAPTIIQAIDRGISQAFRELVEDPRLAPGKSRPGLSAIWRFGKFFVPLILQVLKAMRHPGREREKVIQLFDEQVAQSQARQITTGDVWDDFSRRLELLAEAKDIFPDLAIPRGVPLVVAGMAPFFGILSRFSQEAALATGEERYKTIHLEIARGLPHNITTEMDLDLWEAAKKIKADPAAVDIFEVSPASELTISFLAGALPRAAQDAVTQFLDRYGMRGLGEIDMGRKRWSEDPTHILQVLQSYLQIEDLQLAPDVVFARGAEAAQQAAEQLEREVSKLSFGWAKAHMIHFGVSRYRAIAGMREAPKFFAIRMIDIIRQGIRQSGSEFADAGLLENSDDLFFLTIRELNQIAEEKQIAPQMREKIAERRVLRQREMLRRQIPRVLLSDGTAFFAGVAAPEDDRQAIVGDPVSPGVVEGLVKVVLDPYGTKLEPGEILVCPGTDPAWTPLFLAAGGLVMEVGGMMTHGSVVAREYGIPAVVGVHQATLRLQTGQQIRVDGNRGRITVISDE